MNPRCIAVLLAGLWVGCNTDIGTLLAPDPCSSNDPTCPTTPCTDDTATLRCGVGTCARTVAACVDGAPNTCLPGNPVAELCNGLDDDCDGELDEDCDLDGDGYCSDTPIVVGTPKICPAAGIDCNDSNRLQHPDALEVCEDGVDNNCNGLADYLDVNGCTNVTAAFQDADGIIAIAHGQSRTIRANIIPPTTQIERRWVVVTATPTATCSPEDVQLNQAEERSEATLRSVTIVDDPAKLPCRYEIALLLNGVEADRANVRIGNRRPRVNAMVGAHLDGEELVLRVAAGTRPWLTAIPPADADAVTIQWGGENLGRLQCDRPCVGERVRFASPLPAGTYRLNVLAKDGFDGRIRSRPVRVMAVDCVWVRAGGLGDGSGPFRRDALPSLEAAIAKSGTRNICIAGGGTFDVSAPLTIPVGVSISGAFEGNGTPGNGRAVIRLTVGATIEFAPGYTGELRNLAIRGGRGPLLDIRDARPTLVGLDLTVPGAPMARAIVVTADRRPASVRVSSTSIEGATPLVDAVGIDVVGLASPASLVWNGTSVVRLFHCTGHCRGVRMHGNVSGTLSGERVQVEAFGEGAVATAIDVQGADDAPATAEIRHVSRILVQTRMSAPADETVAIRLDKTAGVSIRNNGIIGSIAANAGRRLAAGIADGAVYRDGTIRPGGSTHLTISRNNQITSGRSSYAWSNTSCNDMTTLEGMDVGAGILLVGTSSATVRGNGSNQSSETAIFGGASSSVWSPNGRVIAPSVPAVWTVATEGVQLISNELRAGYLYTPEACPPASPPPVVAFRDGVSGQASAASTELQIDSNGIVTGLRSNVERIPDLDRVATRLVELYGASQKTAYLANNYISATRGTDLLGLYASGGGEIALWNNVVEIDALVPAAVAMRRKVGVHLEDFQNGPTVDIANTIIALAENPNDAADPVALRLDGPPALRMLRHNLIFVEAAERQGMGAYVRTDTATFGRDDFSAFEDGLENAAANLLLPPLFKARRLDHRRSVTRLSRHSPARDAGQVDGAPFVDRFGQARPTGGGVDIGHHEFTP